MDGYGEKLIQKRFAYERAVFAREEVAATGHAPRDRARARLTVAANPGFAFGPECVAFLDCLGYRFRYDHPCLCSSFARPGEPGRATTVDSVDFEYGTVLRRGNPAAKSKFLILVPRIGSRDRRQHLGYSVRNSAYRRCAAENVARRSGLHRSRATCADESTARGRLASTSSSASRYGSRVRVRSRERSAAKCLLHPVLWGPSSKAARAAG